MTYTVYLSQEAELDLVEACAWYDSQRPNLGDGLLLSVEAKLSSIARNPLLHQKRYKEVRIAFADRFPYGIHYLIEGSSIFVLGIFHMSQNPRNWDNR